MFGNEVIQAQPSVEDILLIKAVKNGDFVSVETHVHNGANVFVRDEYDADLIAIARSGEYKLIVEFLELKQYYLLSNNNNYNNNNNNNQLKLNDLLFNDTAVTDQEYMEVVLSTPTLSGEGSSSADTI